MNATSLITVLLDGEPHALPEGSTVAALVASLDHEPAGVTTAVNGEFVPRGRRADRVLQAGDVVLLFQPIVGG